MDCRCAFHRCLNAASLRVVALLCALIAALAVAPPVGAVDGSRLWLPREYHDQIETLRIAAIVAEHAHQCKMVTAGTLSRERSERDRPVFKITCRDPDSARIVMLVDGVSMKILHTSPPAWEDAALW